MLLSFLLSLWRKFCCHYGGNLISDIHWFHRFCAAIIDGEPIISLSLGVQFKLSSNNSHWCLSYAPLQIVILTFVGALQEKEVFPAFKPRRLHKTPA